MAIKEHPFVVTTTLPGDGTTIKYDVTKPNRSDAVGKAYKYNKTTGKAELVADGDEIDGKVTHVDDKHNITAAYMFAGLRLPLGDGETVAKGDKLVGALGPDSAKGYVKAVPELSLPSDLEDVAANPTQAEHNAVRTAVNSLKAEVETLSGLKGKGSVVDFDSIHALVAFPG